MELINTRTGMRITVPTYTAGYDRCIITKIKDLGFEVAYPHIVENDSTVITSRYEKDGKVLVESSVSKNCDYIAIKIEVVGVPFMCGWRDGGNVTSLDSMIDTIINHFGSLSAEIYTAIVIAYKRAIDEIL